MKLFKFIGKLADHTESIVDSLGGSVVSLSDTVGVYADTQLKVAQQQQPYTLAEAKAECELSLLELKASIADAKAGKRADVDTSKTIDELLVAL